MSERLPPRGNENYAPRVCSRRVSGVLGTDSERWCGEPATAHVFWRAEDPEENAYCCAEHEQEVRRRWQPWKIHAIGADCGMPGSRFYWDENVCRYEGEGLPVAERIQRELEDRKMRELTR